MTVTVAASLTPHTMLTSPHTCTLTDGIVQFCEDAGVDLAEQVEGLVLLWALGQEEQLTLTKNQFVKGMAALNCTTAADIKKAMPSIVSRAYGSDFKCKSRDGCLLLLLYVCQSCPHTPHHRRVEEPAFYKFAFKITTPKGRKNLCKCLTLS